MFSSAMILLALTLENIKNANQKICSEWIKHKTPLSFYNTSDCGKNRDER